MAQQRGTQPSIVGFVVLATLVLAVGGYLGWQAYNAPVDPDGAGFVAVQATEVTVRAAGGDPDACSAMRDLARPGDEDAAVARCEEVASRAAAGSVGPLSVSGLHVTEVKVDRNSGHATVAGTLTTPNGARPTTFTWPLEREGGSWRLGDGEVDVQVG